MSKPSSASPTPLAKCPRNPTIAAPYPPAEPRILPHTVPASAPDRAARRLASIASCVSQPPDCGLHDLVQAGYLLFQVRPSGAGNRVGLAAVLGPGGPDPSALLQARDGAVQSA